MAISLVRKPSATPSISNIDDIISLRYSYGDQNGYVQNKGNELNYEVSGLTFTIKSGRLVIQGAEVDIDANGVSVEIENEAALKYHVVYCNVNLAFNTSEITVVSSYSDYPQIDAGDDLTANTSGSANIELYRFTSQNGVINSVVKIINAIPYTKIHKLDIDYSREANHAQILYNKILENKLLYLELQPIISINSHVQTLTITSSDSSINFETTQEIVLNADGVYKFYPSSARNISGSTSGFHTTYISGETDKTRILELSSLIGGLIAELYIRQTVLSLSGIKIRGTFYPSGSWGSNGAGLTQENCKIVAYYLD